MAVKINSQCPVCSGEIIIKEFQCKDCGITVSGDMKMENTPAISVFGKEDWHFIREFLICEGNLKCLGEKLNKSYPTLKNKLQEIKDKIPGYEPNAEIVDNILNDIESGNIDVKAAINKLKRRK